MPASPEALRTVRAGVGAWLDVLAVSSLDRTAVQHAVGELVSNVIEHAYGEADARRPVSVDLRLTRDGVVDLQVWDEGSWREPAIGATGRGLAMAGSFLDEFDLVHDLRATRAFGRHRISHPAPLLRGSTARRSVRPPTTYALGVEGDVVQLAGTLDARAADAVRAGIARASLGSTRSATVDLAEVDRLGSDAVQVLYDAYASGPLELVAPMGSPAQHVLDVIRLPYRS